MVIILDAWLMVVVAANLYSIVRCERARRKLLRVISEIETERRRMHARLN
jgi:hypothetical protein